MVEVLVVLVLISILSGMVMTAVQGVTTSARIARTRSIIATVDSVIQEQYESYKYRRLPVVTPSAGGLTPGGSTVAFEVLPSEAARVRLIMTRDLMRMEMPDRISDIWQANRTTPVVPPTIRAVADRVIEDPSGNLVLQRRTSGGDLGQRTPTIIDWYNATQRPSRFEAYIRRTNATNSDGTIRWTEQHQGAECLYLILATTFSGGVAAIESIPGPNVADTDGDGIPEILDGWGQPLGFVRWPIGFDDPQINLSVPDEFDPFRSDFRFLLPDASSTGGVVKPFSVRPLVISAGADGEFGIAFSPRINNLVDENRELSAAQIRNEEVDHATQIWPVNAQWMGAEVGGRDPNVPYLFPDPYLRQFIYQAGTTPHLLPGDALEGGPARSWRADNISSYQLEANQ